MRPYDVQICHSRVKIFSKSTHRHTRTKNKNALEKVRGVLTYERRWNPCRGIAARPARWPAPTEEFTSQDSLTNYMCYLQTKDSPIRAFDNNVSQIEFREGEQWEKDYLSSSALSGCGSFQHGEDT